MRKTGETGEGLASLDNFGLLHGTGAVPSHLVPGPGVIRAGDNGLECESLIKELIGV